MQWIRYELKTTTDASSRIGELLTEFGVNGYELQDNVPLSAEEERKMYTDRKSTRLNSSHPNPSRMPSSA